MPAIGLGCWKLPKSEAAEIVYNAIKSGYRCIDQASKYGNEAETGQGIVRALQDGVVERKDLFITSKLWNTFHKREHVLPACERSLKDLGVSYLDLYLVHFPMAMKYTAIEDQYPPDWPTDWTD